MRLSVDKDDPGYDPSNAPYATIYLDGRPMAGVVTADEEEGTVLLHLYDNAGNLLVEEGEVVTTTLEGIVKIVLQTRQ